MTSETALPFEGAEIGPPVDDTCPLDANPRYRVLRGFSSAFLPGERNLIVWLPEAYLSEPDRRFPVFYLHDGQNLIDGRTSYVVDRTWRVHTTADRVARLELAEPVILVGIANMGMRRMAEYTPTQDMRGAGGEGPGYGRMLVEEVKPLIDKTFRTLRECGDTALGGSSLGGLISLALGLDYPEVFGKLAVMSPSVWWDGRSILRLVSQARPRPHLRIWLDMGTAEGLRHLRDCDLLYTRLLALGWRNGLDLKYDRVPGGLHNEDAWAARFDRVLRFLFPAKKTGPEANSGVADRSEIRDT